MLSSHMDPTAALRTSGCDKGEGGREAEREGGREAEREVEREVGGRKERGEREGEG